MTMLLDGKVVCVTGGSSGIGRGIALAAARHGARTVVIGDLQREPREGGTPASDALDALGVRCIFCPTDVTSQDSVRLLVETAAPLGGLDLMVCNAGIALPNDGADIAAADLNRLVEVNLMGVLFSAQAAADQMRSLGKTGSIVMISSIGGLRGAAPTVGYSATKGAVCQLSSSLADALGPFSIRVNAVCPGLIETSLIQSSPGVEAAVAGLISRTPLRRMGQPAEIGDVVAWLGSDLASFVSGVSLPVDGGLTSVI